MKDPRSLQYLRYAAWAGLTLALLGVAIGYVWKPVFWRGYVPGIPQLFIAVGQEVAPLLASVVAIGFLSVLVLWLVLLILRKPRHWQVAISAGILLLALVASLATMVTSMFTEPWESKESIEIHGKTYSLVSQAELIGVGYGLVTCDQRGFICQIVQWFGSYVTIFTPYPGPPTPRLEYDRATDTLYVKSGLKVMGGYQFGPAGGPLLVPTSPPPTPTPIVLGALYGMAWSPDGKRLASGWTNGLVVWDVGTGARIETMEATRNVRGIEWSPDGTRLAATLDPVYGQATDDNLIGIWDAATGQRVRTLGGHGERLGVDGAAWSPDGTLLASGTYLSGTIILWDVETGQKVRILGGDHTPAASRWSPDGTLLGAGYGDGVIILWEVQSGRQVRTFPAYSGNCLEWSPDGTQLASFYWAYPEGTATVWDVQTGAKLHKLTKRHILSGALTWSPAGVRLATGGDSAVLWDMATGEELHTLGARSLLLSWSPDGTRLATSNQGGPIIIWDVETGKQLWTLSKD